ncbi:hypothetical protein [Thalassotalea agarivorans]|uniref:Uncharacterized protein n=1 Tax=Thalassotalea agarivorans TaxID=349064 RepID=A0A1I0ESU3_THASX|nr:hypothetical protein [Thalassotalea agarivorans]SET48568.1 hypothetical protein SAMN05660429_01927 [Thalassotalea agarivorans]
MTNSKVILIIASSLIFASFIIKSLIYSYINGVSRLRFGRTVSLQEDPVIYWISMSIKLFVVLLLFWLAIGLLRICLSDADTTEK